MCLYCWLFNCCWRDFWPELEAGYLILWIVCFGNCTLQLLGLQVVLWEDVRATWTMELDPTLVLSHALVPLREENLLVFHFLLLSRVCSAERLFLMVPLRKSWCVRPCSSPCLLRRNWCVSSLCLSPRCLKNHDSQESSISWSLLLIKSL